MMRRDPAGDQVEACVLERQRFGLSVSRAHIGEAALLRFTLHHVEHFLSNVGCPHALDMRREGVGDVAAAGGDVERAPGLLRGGEGDQPLQALAQRMRRRGEIAGGGLAELLLDQGLVHKSFRVGLMAGL